ncbi:hypothetical protein [Streptomyces sp. Midd1]|uniref:hypothetical protein n=1 Tax=Streptomyces sp. Midd3 TaxID=3161191 RepID=UPI0034DB1DEC
MEKMKVSAALELARREKAAGRSEELAFGGRANTVKPRAAKRITLTQHPRGVVKIHEAGGAVLEETRTGSTFWFAALSAEKEENAE